jgi:UDP-GlcNAc:undecaprenyl-phosphate GlcNAc-1-phosphate transferase
MIAKAIILILVLSMVFTVLLTLLVRHWAHRIGFVATPRVDRYHQRVVPMGGGIALFGTLFTALLCLLVITYQSTFPGFLAQWSERLEIHSENIASHRLELLVLMGCITLLFAVGLWDDRRHLGPMTKLWVQLGVAFAAARFADMRVEFFIHNTWITSALSALWIVVIINAFNFLDNMDGVSAGIAAIVCAILFIAAATSGQILVGGLALVLLGTLMGFLLFNFPPARIFMGDAGSLVVGFLVAVLSLRTTYYHEAQSGDIYRVFIPLIALSVPLYDFISVTTLRLCQGRSPFVGDTQHFSHRLKRRGLTDTQTALTLYLATLCTGLGATFLYQVNQIGAVLIVVQTLLVLIMIAILEAHVPPSSDSSA